MNTAKTDFDIVIVGGGACGSALALMLAQQNRRVLLIEKQAQHLDAGAPQFDERSIALSYGSQRILQALNVWPVLQPYACAIEHIHISDRGHFGHAQLHAHEQQVPALGQVIELRALNSQLYRAVAQRQAATILAPANVIGYREIAEQIVVRISTDGAEQEISAQLLLACDGGQSLLREQAGIGVQVDDYEQCAVVANVCAEKNANGWAYERFTESGPLALLPLTQQRLALVWSLTPQQAQLQMHNNESQFLAGLQQAFGWRLGRFTRVGIRNQFRLQRIVAKTRLQGRLLLMGNAAHQLHPIAGQGFNLALRDCADFAAALSSMPDVTVEHVQSFLQRRVGDTQKSLKATDTLVRLFSNSHEGLSLFRALALDHVSLLSPLRRQLAQQAMGL